MSRLLALLGLTLLSSALIVGAGFSGDAGKTPAKDPGKDTKDTGKDTKNPATKAKGMLPPGWKGLKLTPDQTQKVYTIQGEYKAKINDLKGKISELETQQTTEMVKVLTDEQRATLQKISVGDAPKTTVPPKKGSVPPTGSTPPAGK